MMNRLGVPLSVLDLAPVGEGTTPADALNAAAGFARAVEALGYQRYWVAEHHGMPGIASSAPAVLLAHVASATSTIRLGSGGVMLPNHAPLVVAEQFGMLEALHPGRIDLGLGRAPGTDQVTAHAIRRQRLDGPDEFPSQLAELVGYFDGTIPADHPFSKIEATPARGYRPAIWLLGSSDFSATLAGRLGLPFSFAYHFAPAGLESALHAYRSAFDPSDDCPEPYVVLGVSTVCAETTEQARWLAAPGGLAFLRLRQGRPGRYPRPEDAAAYQYTPNESEAIKAWTSSHVVGTPEVVVEGLAELVRRTGVQELMISTMLASPEDRERSVTLLAEAAGLAAAGRSTVDAPAGAAAGAGPG
ncbi:MAG: LLM class flavin-dependent oxidoreductase [Acidimicrobiales bacterium]|nr:LLM class flavin-dependent oxidoreductase [Acidimicrobiales bacterium]